jgi:peptidoglycan/LPS O-acetylase OafA/YrhL
MDNARREQGDYPARAEVVDRIVIEDPGARPPASDEERLNRELIELLNELRVALPGIQVLFAFLLIVPFQQGFARITDLDRGLYFVAFLATTLACVLLIAPTTYHTIRYEHRDKGSLIEYGERMLIAGTVFLGVAIATVAFLITDVLYGNALAGVATAFIAAWLVWFWYGVPLTRRRRGRGSRG